MNLQDTNFLRTELQKRIDANPRYSMRAFAKHLGVNVGTLSSILNGQRALTIKAAKVFCEKLGYDPEESQKVLDSLKDKANESYLIIKKDDGERFKLENEAYRLISDWYHYGICQLINLDEYGSDPKQKTATWFASQLDITPANAKLALDRLLQMDLIRRDEDGFFVRTKKKMATAQVHTTNSALIKWQKQLREKAIESLENDPIDIRSMTSMTMAIDPKKIKQAKKLIDQFQEDLSSLLESGSKESVYQLTLSLFPLQRKETKK